MSEELKQSELFLIAGEPSGDLHGARLLHFLKQLGSFRFHGVGGNKMKGEGLISLLPLENFHIMGFSQIIKGLPKIFSHFRLLRNKILSENPEAVIFIDYPGFNLKMAKSLRKKGYQGKLIHFICPTIWAWRKNRRKTLCETLDLLITIFPFEANLFKNSSLNVKYIGHPCLEDVKERSSFATQLLKIHDRPIISIFPGSRKSIVLLDLPKQLLGALNLMQEDPAIAICISVALDSLQIEIEKIVSRLNLSHLLNHSIFLIPSKDTYSLMLNSKIAIATCGTVTLELALRKIPTVVVYDVSLLNAFIAKYFFRLKLPYYCIVNILFNQAVYPELMHQEFTSESVYKRALELYKPGKLRDFCINKCSQLPTLLSESNDQESPSKKAAAAILQLLNHSRYN